MSNPTFASGDLTREVSAPVSQYRLVVETSGKVAHGAANKFPFGVVTEASAPVNADAISVVELGYTGFVRVGTSQRVAKVETNGAAIAQGADVFAAADGKVAASGSVKVGIADKATEGTLTRVHLFHPSVFAPAVGG